MKRVVLFSTLTDNNHYAVLAQIFPSELENKTLAYMPSNGVSDAEEYIDEWRGYAKRNEANFIVIDNAATGEAAAQEREKLLNSNILVISGGNTFALLDNLRKSGLDRAILEFTKKPEFILAGFSAGALVLTPTIAICNLPSYDNNLVGLNDLTGLGIVDFEIMPHYNESLQETLKEYEIKARHAVKPITDDQFIVQELEGATQDDSLALDQQDIVNTKKTLKLAIKISKPIAEVFAFTINPANTPKWIDSVVVEQTNEWPVKLSTIYRNQNHAGEWSEYKVTDFEQDKTFTLSKSDGSQLHYSFTTLDANTTELEYEWISSNPDETFLDKILTKLKMVMEENRRIFIIHAWGETPQSYWYPWLKEELESQGAKVIVPEMPDTEAPDMEKWGEALLGLAGAPNESTFFIGHSIGCQTILRYLETLDEGQKIGGAVFVAPWTTLKNLSEESQKIAKPWLETPLNWQAAKAHCPQFVALFSDNDEWVEPNEEKVFQDNLSTKTQMMPDMDHFDGITELPELLSLVNTMISFSGAAK